MVKTLNKLIFTELRGRTVSVLASGNRVLQIGTAPEREDCALGTICVGRVRNIVKNINAAFVEYRPGINGYYSLAENRFHLFADGRDGSSPLKNGDEILVQISRAAVKTKDAVLTSKLSLTGQYGVLTLDGSGLGISSKIRDAGWKEQMKEWWEEEARGLVSGLSGTGLPRAGFILRTNAYGAPLEVVGLELSGQAERMARLLENGRSRTAGSILYQPEGFFVRSAMDVRKDETEEILTDLPDIYQELQEAAGDGFQVPVRFYTDSYPLSALYRLSAALDRALGRTVWLRSGGYLVIEPTEAMTVIDVNTGKNTDKKTASETYLKTNLEAAEEIARQLRLRDIGGMVMIDFVDMVMPANRDLVLRRLVECLARDRTKHQVAEVTSLGLVQMTRKRIGQGLVEAFSEECPTCHGRGFILHDEPTVSADYDDPYALKGGDPFIKTNKHGRGTDVQVPQGSSPDIKAKLAQIAAAAVAANGTDEDE